MKNRKEYHRKWRLNNRERRLVQHREYNQLHREEIIEKQRQYDIEHIEEKRQYMKQWHKDNPKYDREWCNDNPEKMRVINSRRKAKRRQLGYFPLNTPFEDSTGHHISENFIIYIPKIIHQSIAHSIWNWKNMEEINRLAMGYL